MKRYIELIAGSLLAAAFVAGCMEPKVSIYADFKTDKEVYELYEDVIVTNTSYAENALVIASRWDWDGQHIYSHQPETPFSFDKVGEYDIVLTVTTDVGNKSASCTRTVKVQDTNVRPVVDFSWSPSEGLKAGDTVQFTDKSSDPDGSIVSWEWTIGGTVVYDQNPAVELTEFGDIPVTLKVTDNMKGTASKSVMIHVDKSAFSLELLWEKAYEASDGHVKFTSPATNADGSVVYAFSTGCNLVAFSKTGEKLWTFDANKHNPNPYTSAGDKKGNACTPAVDADGNIIIAVAYAEMKPANVRDYESGVYSITSDGKEKWYFPYGNARYIAMIPLVFEDRIVLTTKANPTSADYPEIWAAYGSQDNGHVLNRQTGEFVQMLQIKQGNYGGSAGLKDGTFVTQCNSKYGSRVFFTESGKFKYYGQADNRGVKALGFYNNTNESGDSSQMAVTDDGKVYIIYNCETKRVSEKSVLYCYDLKKYVKDATTAFEPDWVLGIKGAVGRYIGHGVVLGEDGTIYVSTGANGSDQGRITAVSPDGQIKWESCAPGNVAGCAAVDNEGFIYFNEYKAPSKLVKIAAEDGRRVAEITFSQGADDEMRSSPTISADGTIYCTGMKNGVPTLMAVSGSATGPADSWSQLGGNPQKSGVRY